ncbi:MAG TPA: UDP-N-acetylmuramoyl-L-alanine--D-glutamate ligase, partial [Bacteroidota bacterium]|nr:UDP-N-acetylmuramoyl-L-alanine--D-glutamate ligase [Bacteroidota bacterium]
MEILDETMVSMQAVDRSVRGKSVTVIGAARSGLAVAQLLSTNGAHVFVSDSSAAANLQSQIPSVRSPLDNLQSLGIEVETGGHSSRVFAADLIVLSPGVPTSAPVVREAKRRGMRIVSELEVASWFCPAPIIAVTGTNGKTTTTTLIGRLLGDAKKKHSVAGNIGTAFSSVIPELDESSIAVLEVSSFQLDDIESFHPKVAIILNITPDHLDRYEQSFTKYIASKNRVFENQTASDFLIYGYDDPATRESVQQSVNKEVRTLPFGIDRNFDEGAFLERGKLVTIIDGTRTEVIDTEDISIRGIHNLYNSMAGTLAVQLMKVSSASTRATLRNFKGVEHRLEFVRERDGVKYVNDSKATNVDSVWYALQAFKEPIVLILGGRDKGNDYARLIDLVERHVKA